MHIYGSYREIKTWVSLFWDHSVYHLLASVYAEYFKIGR